MTTTLSSKGQVVLPATARRRLGLKSGARFTCRVQGNQIVLTPAEVPAGRRRFIKSRLTGLVVTQGPKGAPVVTSEQVRALLADFP
jgi:AbrB family looped-hinge helix DNA binding protein